MSGERPSQPAVLACGSIGAGEESEKGQSEALFLIGMFAVIEGKNRTPIGITTFPPLNRISERC